MKCTKRYGLFIAGNDDQGTSVVMLKITGDGLKQRKKVTKPAFMFGVSSDKSEAAKALLYPHPTAAEMQVTPYFFGDLM